MSGKGWFVKIAVVALGKIGLPLAVQFADMGHEVVGVDVQQAVVDAVNAGVEPFPGEAHLQEKLSVLVRPGGCAPPVIIRRRSRVLMRS